MSRRLGFGLLGSGFGFGFGLGLGLGLATTTRADKLISVAPTVKSALFEVESRHRPNSKCQEEQDQAVIRCAHGRSRSYDTLKREQRRDAKSRTCKCSISSRREIINIHSDSRGSERRVNEPIDNDAAAYA